MDALVTGVLNLGGVSSNQHASIPGGLVGRSARGGVARGGGNGVGVGVGGAAPGGHQHNRRVHPHGFVGTGAGGQDFAAPGPFLAAAAGGSLIGRYASGIAGSKDIGASFDFKPQSKPGTPGPGRLQSPGTPSVANGGGFGNLKDDRHFYACDDSPDGSRKNPTPRQLHLNKPHMIEPTPPPLASGSLAGRPPGTSDANKPPSTVARSNPSTHSAMVAILQGQEGINRRQEEFNGEQRRHNDMMADWWVQQGQQWVQHGQHNANVNEKLVNFGQTQREQGERLDDIEASNRERDANTDAQRSEFEARLGKLEDQGGGAF